MTPQGGTTAPPPLSRVAPARSRAGLADPVVLVYLALVAVYLIGWVIVGMRGGDFVTVANTVTILQNSAALGLVAIGQTYAILAGSLDLSVAYLISLVTLITAQVMEAAGIVAGVAAALLLAGLVGLGNGLIVTKLKVNAFIATLGVALILRGYLENTYTGPAGDVPTEFQRLGYDRIGPLPVSVFLVAAVATLTWFVLRRTSLGHHIYAVGGDREVARLSGVRTDRTVIAAHVLCSLCAGLAGVFLASRLGAGAPLAGTDGQYDLVSIAAVVLGGSLLAGGRGGVVGTIGGVLILSVLDNVFDQVGVDPFFKNVVRGVVIIAAVALYARQSVARRGQQDQRRSG
ncbi:ribose transport system permease protein [Actinoalloteichus hoggarensis]|uniref:Ribose transport system permease protein RbsC n=1 Tax=Actinoalloteichus hoggarensis TaxID=1470176 RepID=A0A221W628_9PSEU|nr:ABC transporter permease [Actinoalloteichus hoggarensis]ASO21318.1 Ribose transport system permease protein RbsC [Actinoalloteichus hoggarensis]MBB5921251.1 ribose transport system permease protein [Actinoalloteichus hoggarensis]